MDEIIQIPTQVNQLLENYYNDPNPSIEEQIENLLCRFLYLGGKIYIDGNTVTSVYPYNPEFEGSIEELIQSQDSQECDCGCHHSVDISKLKCIRMNKKTKDNVNKSCTICLEPFKSNNKLYGLSCNHYFHKKCIERWFRGNITCPTCRKEQEIL